MRCACRGAASVGPVPARIPSEQREPRDRGVRPNEEVGQDAGAHPTLRAVTLKCLARKKESRARRLHKFETDIRKNFVYLELPTRPRAEALLRSKSLEERSSRRLLDHPSRPVAFGDGRLRMRVVERRQC
jgi:hypothetical protein